jgi:hypothetical protein
MSIKDDLPKFEYWRKKANEARAMADQMDDRVAKDMALKIAEMYDALAGRVAE